MEQLEEPPDVGSSRAAAGMASSGLFHTFQGFVAPKSTPKPKPPPDNEITNKRITTTHACTECKRRKIRCDGNHPCTPCSTGRAKKKCVYDRHRQRIVPSRRVIESLTHKNNQYQQVLTTLFPDHRVEDLSSLTREALVQLISNSSLPESSTRQSFKHETKASPTARPGIKLESPEPKQSQSSQQPTPKADMPPPPVYKLEPSQAISSVKESIDIMAKVKPTVRDLLSVCPGYLESLSVYPTIEHIRSSVSAATQAWLQSPEALIDAYFCHAHELMPMIDEATFRQIYADQSRHDAPWQCLLNIVLATGCLFVSDSDDCHHLAFYAKSMSFLDLDSKSEASLDTVQALAIAGGFYLPYINKPAMAGSFLGASVRMARSLHIDVLASSGGSLTSRIYRRTWLSLVSLSSWISTSPTHSAYYSPEALPDILTTEFEAGKIPMLTDTMAVEDHIRLSAVASAIYAFLGRQELPLLEEYQALDSKLQSWYSSSPLMNREQYLEQDSLVTASRVLKWRYYSLRIVLYRKRMFELAAEGTIDHSAQDLSVVSHCRSFAKQVLQEQVEQPIFGQYLARTAACLVYDAVMVPLVSLFWEANSSMAQMWTYQVKSTLPYLAGLQPWTTVARDARDIVEKLFGIFQGSRYVFDSVSSSLNESPQDFSPINIEDTRGVPNIRGFDSLPRGALYHGENWVSTELPIWLQSTADEGQSMITAPDNHMLSWNCQPQGKNEGFNTGGINYGLRLL